MDEQTLAEEQDPAVDPEPGQPLPPPEDDAAFADPPAFYGEGDGDGRRRVDWSGLWQVPAIVSSVLLIVAGLYVAAQRAPRDDFDGVLAEIEQLIGAADLEGAQLRIHEVIQPNLDRAEPAQRARYHAVVADWVAASQHARGVSLAENNRIIDEQYEKASALGLIFSLARTERWANALVELGETEGARQRLAELEALTMAGASQEEARFRRNRLLRRLVETSLEREGLSSQDMMSALDDYRHDALLSGADRAWVALQMARLRLAAGDPISAIDHLLVDMRRLEQSGDSMPEATWGEMYGLLGRASFDAGLDDHAVYYLGEALARLPETSVARADVLFTLGRRHMAAGRPGDALERFDEVIDGFVGAPVGLPALLGRAEVRSILGDHDGSLADYRALLEAMPDGPPPRGLSRVRIADSLADRHDAALTMGDLALALEYVVLAESMFSASEVPVEVLARTASTTRQIADDMMAEAGAPVGEGAAGGDRPSWRDVPPDVRHEAAKIYERAADYFLRHARSIAAQPESDADWAQSLWLAADSFDLAGRRDAAITHFLEYIAGRPTTDPRRAEVTFRLAQALEAEGRAEDAAERYLQVIDEHPRSTFGTASHVPLARCLEAVGRAPEAEQTLVRIVDGREGEGSPLDPEARDYREAMLELGRLHYDAGQFEDAIERLTAALDRYPDDPRANEARFRLADSYLNHARGLAARVESDPGLAPGDRLAMAGLRRDHLERALDLFGQVVDAYSEGDPRQRSALQRDYRRYAALSRGDTAFALERYELAARLFDQAARQYSEHHSSMHALVQIVNCYDRLGRTEDADVAHHNALIRLRQLPDAAFSDPQALMDRAAWEQWLQHRPVGVAKAAEDAATN